jgi:hypothetical protein
LPPFSFPENILRILKNRGFLRTLRTKTLRIVKIEFKIATFSWYANLLGGGILRTGMCTGSQILDCLQSAIGGFHYGVKKR